MKCRIVKVTGRRGTVFYVLETPRLVGEGWSQLLEPNILYGSRVEAWEAAAKLGYDVDKNQSEEV